jgi:protein-disulfide isomerase
VLFTLALALAACAHHSAGPSLARSGSARVTPSIVTARQDLAASIATWTPVRGNRDALVTVVEYADFECPFCARVHPTIEALRSKYGDKLRVAFRHLPLPFHVHSKLAAEASMAAKAQGKFWEMHDALFALGKVDPESIRGAAQQVGLDLAAFDAALLSHRYAKEVDDDVAHAGAMGVRGTPTFFINGEKLNGAQPIEAFEAAVDEQLKIVDAMLAAGAPRDRLYDLRLAVLTADKADKAEEPARQAPAKPQKAHLATWTPIRGPKLAKVTIVEFSDFQCPFCARVDATLRRLRDDYGADLRIAYRHNPLPFHTNARQYAEMALAAQDQGKFWEMHDWLFEHQSDMPADFVDAAGTALGLDLRRYKKAIATHAHDVELDSDIDEAKRLGARGTPTFFVNGQPVIGAQPYEVFKETIDSERKKAQALVDQGTPLEELYEKMLSDLPAP